MTDREIIRHIDDGANFYIRLFGDAVHMENTDGEFYSCVRPKAGEHGISFIYNVRIEQLAPKQKKAVIDEMKSMHMPIWLSLLASEETVSIFRGEENAPGESASADACEDGETYLAILPEQKRECPLNSRSVIQVRSAGEFAVWAQIANDILAGGMPDMHPVHHFALCEKKLMKCYVMYHDGVPVSAAAIMDNHGIDSLEFVATIPEMRRRGFARAVCAKAVYDAFSDGASIVTVRAVNAAARKLYEAVGFTVYG